MRHNNWKEKVEIAKVPSYFKASLIKASLQNIVVENIGSGLIRNYRHSYLDPGTQLAIHMDDLLDNDVLERFDDKYEPLFGRFNIEDIDKHVSDAVREQLVDELSVWLKRHMYRFYSLVPYRRRRRFVWGFCGGLTLRYN